MSFMDSGIQRDNELSCSNSTSQEQFNGRVTERLLHNSTPTRYENPVIFSPSQPSLPQHLQNTHPPTFESHRSGSPMDYGGHSFGGPAQQVPSTNVLLSDEVVSGSLTDGKRMS